MLNTSKSPEAGIVGQWLSSGWTAECQYTI